MRRDILPIPDAKHVGLTTYDAKDPNTTYPPITMLRPPEGLPNVLIVLIDDVGFDDMMELVAGRALIGQNLRPVHDGAVAGAAPVRGDLLGPLIRAAQCVHPPTA